MLARLAPVPAISQSGDVEVSVGSTSEVTLFNNDYVVVLTGTASGTYEPASGYGDYDIDVIGDWTADIYPGDPNCEPATKICTITAGDVALAGPLYLDGATDIHDLDGSDSYAVLDGGNSQGDLSAPCGFSPWSLVNNGSVEIEELCTAALRRFTSTL